MPNKGFESLDVYKLSAMLADEIWRIVLKRDGFEKETIGKQVIRAADGVGANIAEGTGRGSFPDNRRFVRMARRSLYETRHWLPRADARKLLTDAQVASLKQIIKELAPRLNAYLRSIGRAVHPASDKGQTTRDK